MRKILPPILLLSAVLTVLLLRRATPGYCTMTVTGPITANEVSVTGEVTVDNITVSSMAVTNVLSFSGPYTSTAGLVLQMKFSSTTAITSTTNTAWIAVDGMAQTISLSNSLNHIRISLSGGLFINGSHDSLGYVTIFRDGTNLGNATFGFTSAFGLYFPFSTPFNVPGTCSAGITIIDSPGDTNLHTYQAYIYTDDAMDYVAFPKYGAGYLILEEISH